MSNAENALQEHEKAWLRYQHRIVAHIFCEEPVPKHLREMQAHHEEEYLKLQCTEILHELLNVSNQPPDS